MAFSLIVTATILSAAITLVHVGRTVAEADNRMQIEADNVKAYRQIFQYDNAILKPLDVASLIMNIPQSGLYVNVSGHKWNSSTDLNVVLPTLTADQYRCKVITDTMTPNYSSVLGFEVTPL